MRQIVFLTALLGLSALNCSSSKPSGPEFPDASSFCAGLAKAQCSDSIVNQCFGTPSVASSDRTSCTVDRQSACETEIVEPAQALGLTYDSGQAAACVHTTGSAYADGKISSTDTASIANECGAVFTRLGVRNSVCTSDVDCNRGQGLRCIIHPTNTTADAGPPEGTCQQPTTPVPGGNSCAAPDAICAPGYHCGSTQHCDQDLAAGSRNCNAVDVCATTARCSSDGVCVNKLASTAACTSDDDCQSGICAPVASICVDPYMPALNDPFCTAMRQ